MTQSSTSALLLYKNLNSKHHSVFKFWHESFSHSIGFKEAHNKIYDTFSSGLAALKGHCVPVTRQKKQWEAIQHGLEKGLKML